MNPRRRTIDLLDLAARKEAAATALETADDHNPFWDYPGVQVESTRSWGLISAEIVSRTAGRVVWRSRNHRIVYALSDIHGMIRNGNGPPQTRPLMRDHFSFRPGGITLQSTIDAPVRFIHIVQSREVYDNITSEMVRGGVVDFEPRTGLHDPLISQIALTIGNEIEGEYPDHVLADALNTALAVQVTRLCTDPAAIALEPSNGLSRERLRRVYDYIEVHLDDRLTLTDLARVACLSPYHFSRSFKQAVGVGPQRYVMRRRVERAKALMRLTDQSLAIIAQEVGFADQSHLISVFRREIGVTPGHFRAALS